MKLTSTNSSIGLIYAQKVFKIKDIEKPQLNSLELFLPFFIDSELKLKKSSTTSK